MSPPTKVDVGGFSGRAAVITAALLIVVLVGVVIVATGDAGPDRSTSDDGRTVVSTITAAATTTQPITATSGPCESVRALFDFAGAGPDSADETDMRDYLTTTGALVDDVVEAYGPIATDELVIYAATYERIIDAENWDPGDSPDGAELSELAEAVERQLAADCDIDG